MKIGLIHWKGSYTLKQKILTERGRDSKRSHPVCWFTPWMVRTARIRVGLSQKLLPPPPHGCRDPNTWTIVCCFSQVINREQKWKCSSQDTNLLPYRMMMLYVAALLAMPQCWPYGVAFVKGCGESLLIAFHSNSFIVLWIHETEV